MPAPLMLLRFGLPLFVALITALVALLYRLHAEMLLLALLIGFPVGYYITSGLFCLCRAPSKVARSLPELD